MSKILFDKVIKQAKLAVAHQVFVEVSARLPKGKRWGSRFQPGSPDGFDCVLAHQIAHKAFYLSFTPWKDNPSLTLLALTKVRHKTQKRAWEVVVTEKQLRERCELFLSEPRSPKLP